MRKKMLRRIFFLLCIAAVAAGCAGPAVETRPAALEEVPRGDWPRFTDDMAYDGLVHAIRQSCSYLERLDPEKQFFFGKDAYTVSHVIRSLITFERFIRNRPSAPVLNRFIKSRFRLYRSVGAKGDGNVLFTGYYEPILEGRLEKDPPFIYPLYARPPDLATIDLGRFNDAWKGQTLVGRCENQAVVPYYDRKAIDVEKRLEGKATPLVYLKDPVDAFFLQIQGSGKIYVNGDRSLNVHYHISNGRPYRSIGKLLIEKNRIDPSRMSMQRIRAYLEAHPEEISEIFNYNPSYVFFKLEEEGPKGALDVVLTPGRSIALDRRLFPPAALTFIETQKPVVDAEKQIRKWIRFGRFAIHQDTGGAIGGPGRADLFWGNGPYAEIAAGHMQHPGRLYFLVLKPDA
ncbi:MAG: MltA domain-containing protein [Deltaproteobacteria bacterium]|nr:MltA domain-containing protein [Deltaproteobacteria bacterium]